MYRRWPGYVRKRLVASYFYLGNSLAITTVSALLAYKHKIHKFGLWSTLVIIFGTGITTYCLKYKRSFGKKQIAWILYCGSLGVTFRGFISLGEPNLLKASHVTLVITGILTVYAIYSREKLFMRLGSLLGMFIGVLFISSLSLRYFIYPSLHRFTLYGGLILFSALILYDSGRMIEYAEMYPVVAQLLHIPPFDPISALWPSYVKKRIRATYFYFGSSLLVTATSAAVSFSSSGIMQFLVGRSMFFSFGLIVLTGVMARAISYKEGFGIKQMAWLLHVGTIGILLAPMCFLGGPVLTQALHYTAGAIAGLSTIAVVAPGRKFLSMGAPLGMALGVIIVSTMASTITSPTSAIGTGLYGITVYGGLALFSLFLLCDTQYIIFMAETYPLNHKDYDLPPYDPINSAMSIYADALNIFSYVATVLSNDPST